MLIIEVETRYFHKALKMHGDDTMYKTILVPLDGSKYTQASTNLAGSKRAENILKHVEQLAFCYDAKVIFLQVLKPPTRVDYGILDPKLYERQLDDQLKAAKNYLDGHKGQFMENHVKGE